MTNKELLSKLLKIPKKRIRGKSMAEIINSLPDSRASLVKEICCRYGERRLKEGESFTGAAAIYEHFKIRLSEEKQEQFIAVYLDNKHRIISEKMITQGTLNQSLVHPREVFSPAIEKRAAAIILIHNHPSGDPKPSQQDIEITKRLSEVGKIVGIKILDHIIIGEGYFSFVDENMMEF